MINLDARIDVESAKNWGTKRCINLLKPSGNFT
jgi:hypothetical protein